MNFSEILKNVQKGELLLGHKSNRVLSVKVADFPSIIITGSTGTGKSVLLNEIIMELTNTYTSNEMGLMMIDTSGVELINYKGSNYEYMSAIKDNQKAHTVISKFIQEMDRRRELIKNANYQNVIEYNEKEKQKLPLIVLAIDDDSLFLRNEDMDHMLKGVFETIKGLNMMVILSTSDIYSKLFKRNKNILASILISFDYQSKEDEKVNNLENSSNLGIGEFVTRIGTETFTYNNFKFDNKKSN